MDRDIAVALLDQLHAAQNEFYGGGGDALLRDLLASDIAWTVPGNNSIAGDYQGTEAVFDYHGQPWRRASAVASADSDSALPTLMEIISSVLTSDRCHFRRHLLPPACSKGWPKMLVELLDGQRSCDGAGLGQQPTALQGDT